jgi:chloramphenicol 3-O phosphotransferase
VGVVCAVVILERRDASRGDRVLGRTRGLAVVVHQFCECDVVVDTGRDNPQVCVEHVALVSRS